MVATVDNRIYHQLVLPDTLFKDADGDIDKYMATSNEPYVTAWVTDDNEVLLDVTRKVVDNFPLVVYAVDDDGEMSEPVTLTVKKTRPIRRFLRSLTEHGEGRF